MLAIWTGDLIRSAGGRLEQKDEEVDRSDSHDKVEEAERDLTVDVGEEAAPVKMAEERE